MIPLIWSVLLKNITKLEFCSDIYSYENSCRDETELLLVAMKSAKDAKFSINSYLSQKGQNLLQWKSQQDTEPRKQLTLHAWI